MKSEERGTILMTEKVSNQLPAIETSIIYEAKIINCLKMFGVKNSGTRWKDEIEYTN
jgi:hypothetical protein